MLIEVFQDTPIELLIGVLLYSTKYRNVSCAEVQEALPDLDEANALCAELEQNRIESKEDAIDFESAKKDLERCISRLLANTSFLYLLGLPEAERQAMLKAATHIRKVREKLFLT